MCVACLVAQGAGATAVGIIAVASADHLDNAQRKNETVLMTICSVALIAIYHFGNKFAVIGGLVGTLLHVKYQFGPKNEQRTTCLVQRLAALALGAAIGHATIFFVP